MTKSILTLLVGDLDEKRAYRRMLKRVKALPEDYRFAFKKIEHYWYSTGTPCAGLRAFEDLLELLEGAAAQNTPVLQVIGQDVAGFCDELGAAYAPDAHTTKEKLNEEIRRYFETAAPQQKEAK